MPKFLIDMPCEGKADARRKWTDVLGASCGSPCKFERAYVDPATGHTTCVWDAPSQRSVDAVFRKAKVEPCCVTKVDEVTEVSPGRRK